MAFFSRPNPLGLAHCHGCLPDKGLDKGAVQTSSVLCSSVPRVSHSDIGISRNVAVFSGQVPLMGWKGRTFILRLLPLYLTWLLTPLTSILLLWAAHTLRTHSMESYRFSPSGFAYLYPPLFPPPWPFHMPSCSSFMSS